MKFKKGESGNPAGSLPIGDQLKLTRRINRDTVEERIWQYWLGNFEDIEKTLSNKEKVLKTPVLDLMVMSIMRKAVLEGDVKSLNFFMDRTLGQVIRKIRVEHEVENVNKEIPVDMTSAEKLEMLKRYQAHLEKDVQTIEVKNEANEDSPNRKT